MAARLGALERRIESTLGDIEHRIGSVASRAGLATAGTDVKDAVVRMLPRARRVLAATIDAVRLVEPPERCDPFGLDPRLSGRFEPLLDLLYGTWWRVEAHGLEHVPGAGPLIVVANHAGPVPWDALVLAHALRREHAARRVLRPLLDDREVELPVFGWLAVRLGAVRATPDAAERILRDGGAVGVFPEGSSAARKPWRDRYRIQRFGRGGFVKIALRTGATVVPCAIVGSEEATPGIARPGWIADVLGVPALGSPALRVEAAAAVPLPSRWSLRFGGPIDLGGPAPERAADAAAVNEITERVRETLEAMLDESVAARGSVFL